MFDHVGIRVSDRTAAEAVYARLLGVIGIEQTYTGEEFAEWDDFALGEPDAEHPLTRRLHIGFGAPSRDAVDAFWRAGIAAGWRDDGEPGPRPQYRDDYYGGFLRDPDGNSIEAVHHGGVGGPGGIDHLWIRVRDLAAAEAFYATIAAHAGLEEGPPREDRAWFRGRGGSFTLLEGEPTANVHVAFPAPDDATVIAFHRAALAAGYRDNGAPGERPEYHAGYYAAFVLDPDGNNVEVVNHNR